jgi:site-specific recombinase XerC
MATPILLYEAADRYLEHLKQQNKSSRTLYTYGKDLEQVQLFFGPERPLTSILKGHVGKFYKSSELLAKPDGSPRAQASLTKTIRVFRMFMLWAHEQGYLEALPLTKDTPMGRSRKANVQALPDESDA